MLKMRKFFSLLTILVCLNTVLSAQQVFETRGNPERYQSFKSLSGKTEYTLDLSSDSRVSMHGGRVSIQRAQSGNNVSQGRRAQSRIKVSQEIVDFAYDKSKFESHGSIFRFGPHGTKFDEPMLLTLPYENIHDGYELSFDIFYYNADAGTWEKMRKVSQDVENNTITAEIWHFSEYAVGSGSNKPIEGFNKNITYLKNGSEYVDPRTGTLIYKRNDINLKGRGGLDLSLDFSTSGFTVPLADNWGMMLPGTKSDVVLWQRGGTSGLYGHAGTFISESGKAYNICEFINQKPDDCLTEQLNTYYYHENFRYQIKRNQDYSLLLSVELLEDNYEKVDFALIAYDQSSPAEDGFSCYPLKYYAKNKTYHYTLMNLENYDQYRRSFVPVLTKITDMAEKNEIVFNWTSYYRSIPNSSEQVKTARLDRIIDSTGRNISISYGNERIIKIDDQEYIKYHVRGKYLVNGLYTYITKAELLIGQPDNISTKFFYSNYEVSSSLMCFYLSLIMYPSGSVTAVERDNRKVPIWMNYSNNEVTLSQKLMITGVFRGMPTQSLLDFAALTYLDPIIDRNTHTYLRNNYLEELYEYYYRNPNDYSLNRITSEVPINILNYPCKPDFFDFQVHKSEIMTSYISNAGKTTIAGKAFFYDYNRDNPLVYNRSTGEHMVETKGESGFISWTYTDGNKELKQIVLREYENIIPLPTNLEEDVSLGNYSQSTPTYKSMVFKKKSEITYNVNNATNLEIMSNRLDTTAYPYSTVQYSASKDGSVFPVKIKTSLKPSSEEFWKYDSLGQCVIHVTKPGSESYDNIELFTYAYPESSRNFAMTLSTPAEPYVQNLTGKLGDVRTGVITGNIKGTTTRISPENFVPSPVDPNAPIFSIQWGGTLPVNTSPDGWVQSDINFSGIVTPFSENYILYDPQTLSVVETKQRFDTTRFQVTKFQYDSYNNLLEIDLPNGSVGDNKITLFYEDATKANITRDMQLLKSTAADPGKYKHNIFQYDSLGRLTNSYSTLISTAVPPLQYTVGSTTTKPIIYTYDSIGRVVSVNAGNPKNNNDQEALRSYTYNDSSYNGIIGASNTILKFVHLDKDNKIRTLYNYDHFDRLIKESVSKYEVQNATPDIYGSTTYEYHPVFMDKVVKKTYFNSANEKVSEIFTYDGLGRVIRLEKEDKNNVKIVISRIYYDDEKRTVLTRDYVTSTQYRERTEYFDSLGRKIKEVANSALNRGTGNVESITEYGYTVTGQLSWIRKPINVSGKRQLISYEYNTAGKITKITHDAGTSSQTTEVFEYDLMGNIIRYKDRAGKYTINAYDSIGRLYQQQIPSPTSSVDGYFLYYSYDVTSQPERIQKKTANGTILHEEIAKRDDLGRVIRLENKVNANGSVPSMYIGLTYAYNRAGSVTNVNKIIPGASETFIPLVSETVLYPTNTITYLPSASTSDPQSIVKVHADGKLAQIEFGTEVAKPVSTFYGYDAFRRLSTIDTRQSSTSPSLVANSYVYDNQSGITTWNGKSYIYDGLNRLVTESDSTGVKASFTYDPVGNRLSAVTGTSSYNDINRLTKAADGSAIQWDANGNMLGRGLVVYEYDGKNQLVRVKNGSTVVGSYDYTSGGVRLRKTEGGKTTVYLYAGNACVYEKEYTGTAVTAERYFHQTAGMTVAEIDLTTSSPKVTFNVLDHLGSKVGSISTAGVVTKTSTYGLFGELKGGTAEQYRFTDKRMDAGTSLVYFNARYYDPRDGRFITEDPAKDGLNWYAYCNNNPVNFVDPTGLEGLATWLSNTINGYFSSRWPGVQNPTADYYDKRMDVVPTTVNNTSAIFDLFSDFLSHQVYLAEKEGNVGAKALGFEIKTDLNIFKGNFYSSIKVLAGAELKISDPMGIGNGAIGTFFAEGVLGVKEGALIGKAKVASVQLSGQVKDFGINSKVTAFVGLGVGLEFGQNSFGLEGAPAGVGGGFRLSWDPQSLCKRVLE